MEMPIGGTWQPAASGRTEEVTSPFGGAVIGTVPAAGPDDVRAALNRPSPALGPCAGVRRRTSGCGS
jgi:acyl-CoA reductase-like NAD-dependent aldehyde dehydrogenase